MNREQRLGGPGLGQGCGRPWAMIAGSAVLAGWWGLAPVTAAQSLSQEVHDAGAQVVRFAHPSPVPSAGFGAAVAALDVFVQGTQELVVGAPGEGAVYVFLGLDLGATQTPYTHLVALQADGLNQVPVQSADDQFGFALAVGQLDGDAAAELLVGAPGLRLPGPDRIGAVFVFGGATGATPIVLGSFMGSSQGLGTSVAVGDINGDGHGDVVAGEPKGRVHGVVAGRVHVYFGPFDGQVDELVIHNPDPVPNGNFGAHLAVSDVNGDGLDDLYVSAIGNTVNGLVHAGLVYRFEGPVRADVYQQVEDPFPNPADQPGPRFAMHLDARENLLAVGAPRKDWAGVEDAGLGLVFRGPASALVSLHAHPTPQVSDVLGFRTRLADVMGDAQLDVIFITLPVLSGTHRNPRALLAWDGTDLAGPPFQLSAIAGSQDHFAEGLSSGQLVVGGYEELIVGDPSYDVPGTGTQNNSGRVVVYLGMDTGGGGMRSAPAR